MTSEFGNIKCELLIQFVKDYELRVLRLKLNFFYSDASITKAVFSVWELLLE